MRLCKGKASFKVLAAALTLAAGIGAMTAASTAQAADAMHLPDGPRQRERDRAMRRAAGLTGLRERAWLYGHEAGAATPA